VQRMPLVRLLRLANVSSKHKLKLMTSVCWVWFYPAAVLLNSIKSNHTWLGCWQRACKKYQIQETIWHEKVVCNWSYQSLPSIKIINQFKKISAVKLYSSLFHLHLVVLNTRAKKLTGGHWPYLSSDFSKEERILPELISSSSISIV